MPRTLLIDADAIIHRFAWSHQLDGDGDAAEKKMEGFILSAMRTTECTDAVWCFSCSPSTDCFRFKVWPLYKANRKDLQKPILFERLRSWAQTKKTKVKPELEGDDVLGILATQNPGSVILSPDKDLMQIPGLNYTPGRPLTMVTQEEADRWFYTQVLTGDTTDGYPGCPGIGPVRARAILDAAGEDVWPSIVHAYISKGLSESDAVIQARCARILRVTDWNFKIDKPQMWEPGSKM